MAQHVQLLAHISHLQKRVARLEEEKQEILETAIKVCRAVGLDEDSPVLGRLVSQLNSLKQQHGREEALDHTQLSERASDVEVSVEVKREPNIPTSDPQLSVSLELPVEHSSSSCQKLSTVPNDEASPRNVKSEGIFAVETEDIADSDSPDANLNSGDASKHEEMKEIFPETVADDNSASDSDMACSSTDPQLHSDPKCSIVAQTICTKCGAQFNDLTELKLHNELHLMRKYFYCCTCNSKFRYKHELVHHYQNTENKCASPFNCSHCTLPFVTDDERRRHEIVHTDQRFACSHCTAYLTTFRALERHEATHTGMRRYICSTCGKGFGVKAHLEDHERLHTKDLPFLCPTCGTAFRTKVQVKTHQNNYHPADPDAFVCDLCGKKMATKAALGYHSRYHKLTRSLPCGDCDQMFRTSSALKQHRRCHTGERPFACSICPARFKQKCTLQSHEAFHTNKRPFSCSQCSLRFVNKSDLVRHERIHAGVKPFACEFCDLRFCEKGNLTKHVKNKHPHTLPS